MKKKKKHRNTFASLKKVNKAYQQMSIHLILHSKPNRVQAIGPGLTTKAAAQKKLKIKREVKKRRKIYIKPFGRNAAAAISIYGNKSTKEYLEHHEHVPGYGKPFEKFKRN